VLQSGISSQVTVFSIVHDSGLKLAYGFRKFCGMQNSHFYFLCEVKKHSFCNKSYSRLF